MPVAGDTVHLRHFYMGGVRKKYVLRLPRIDQPGNLPLLGNIFVYEFCFLRILSVDLFMTINALGQFGDTGIRAVFPEKMAAFTAIFNLFIVQGMVEVNRLLFLGVKKLREDYPSNNKTCLLYTSDAADD
mgnify:CR=1 FL=1